MSYTKLSKQGMKQDNELSMFINERPVHTKAVTIAPNHFLWHAFTQHVKTVVGPKRVSRMVNYLVYTYLKTAKAKPVGDWEDKQTIVVTLSVDQDVWEDFTNKLREMHSKHKIQSEVLNDILKEYLANVV